VKKGGGKFCSKKCADLGKRKRVKRICLSCGKEFEVIECLVKEGYGKFCSGKCHAKYMRKRVRKVCEVCGKEFEVEKGRAEKGEGRFCSRECFVKYVKGEEHKKKMSEISKRFWQDPEYKEKLSEKVKELWQDPEYRKKVIRQREKVCKSLGFRKKQSEISKRFWQDPEYREKNIRSRVAKAGLKPNGLERAFCDLLQNYFLGEWRYVGDGKIFIVGFVPDFIHKEEDWIIELNGDYWHSFPEAREKDERKRKVYEKYGYKVLEVWESEFRSNPMAVVSKIMEYFYEEKREVTEWIG
jgi:very-short-patch-repair endonuclease